MNRTNILILLALILFLEACNNSDGSKDGTVNIRIGFVTPLTGPLASFGESSDFLVARAEQAMNDRKIKVNGKTAVFKIITADGQSNPTKAGEQAGRLIDQDHVSMIVTAGAPPTINPVAAVCEAKKIPCVSGNSPLDSWLAGGPYKYCFHFFWDMNAAVNLFAGMWNDVPTNKKVGGLWANDADGIAWADAFMKGLPAKGYQVIDLGRFPIGTSDYTAFIQKLKSEHAEVLTGNLPPPDFASFWRQCSQQGYQPKIATVGKALLFPAAVEALGGNLPEGLSCEVWWSPANPFTSSLTRESAAQLAAAYPKQWTQTLGFSHAIFEVAADAVQRAGSIEPEALIKAITTTDLNTIVGPIKFNEQHYALTPLLGGQWTRGTKYPWDLKIVNNAALPAVRTETVLKPINAGQ